MKIRELLRYEIWSKKTTRRILIGVVIFIGLIFASNWIWTEYELHWLTSGERKAAKAALAEIDLLAAAGIQLSDQEWEARTQQAKTKLEATRKSARTYRDVFVEDDLSLYLLEFCFSGSSKSRAAKSWGGPKYISIQFSVGQQMNPV